MFLEIEDLPTLNAILNFFAFVCLCLGYRAIKKGDREKHKKFMISAFAISSAFLVSYLTYRFTAGHKVFPDLGWIKTAYLLILIPHVILAAVMVPMILLTFYRAYKQDWEKHKKIAKITFPIWSYVSVTGVIIYFFLKIYYF